MHLNAYDAATIYSALETYVDYCKAIRHPPIRIRNMRNITPTTCSVVVYSSDSYISTRGPFSYPGLWYALSRDAHIFKSQLHENKHSNLV